MKLKELVITKTYKGKDPKSADRFDRVEAGITKTYELNEDEKYNIEELNNEIEIELQTLQQPDPEWIKKEKKEE